MNIVFISNSGECLPIAWRMTLEGVNCKVYLHNKRYRHNYDGIVKKIGITELRKAVRIADMVIFDITRVNEKTKQDMAMLKLFGVSRTAKTVFGPVADKIKKHTLVIGASSWTEQIEMNRELGVEIARKIGLSIPETRQFNSLEQGARFLEGRKDMWVFKPHNNMDLDMTYVEKFPGELRQKMMSEYKERIGTDKVSYILQKRIEGVEISTEGWFDGERWVHFNHTIEDKRLMNYNLGPAIGSQSNTVWVKKDLNGLLVKEIVKLSPYLKAANYIGPVDINCIVAEEDKRPYFLEFSPRFGYDAIYCLLTLVKGPIMGFFKRLFNVKFYDGYASSQRITIPPFPYSDGKMLDAMAKDTTIEGKLSDYPHFWMQDVYVKDGKIKCAGADGIIGVLSARGNSIGGSVGNMYRAINDLKICSYLQYRTDGGRRAEKAIKKFEEWGISVG